MKNSDVNWDDCCCEGPFHEGECEAQKKAGEQDIAKRVGRVITDSIPSGAIEFINMQSLVVTSSIDNEGDIWTSIFLGKPGFVTTLSRQKVKINVSDILGSKTDPFWENIDVVTVPTMGYFDPRALKAFGFFPALQEFRLYYMPFHDTLDVREVSSFHLDLL